MKHKHYDCIVAWAEGKPIQFRYNTISEWTDAGPRGKIGWYDCYEYRIKPEPKPDVVRWTCLKEESGGAYRTSLWTVLRYVGDNLKATFDGETGKLKSVEIVYEENNNG